MCDSMGACRIFRLLSMEEGGWHGRKREGYLKERRRLGKEEEEEEEEVEEERKRWRCGGRVSGGS